MPIDEQTAAVLGTGLATFFGVLFAARRGGKKHPTDVGSEPPPPDMAQYLLTEVRELAKKLTGLHTEFLEHKADTAAALEELSDKGNAIHTDTQVLRDRRDR